MLSSFSKQLRRTYPSGMRRRVHSGLALCVGDDVDEVFGRFVGLEADDRSRLSVVSPSGNDTNHVRVSADNAGESSTRNPYPSALAALPALVKVLDLRVCVRELLRDCGVPEGLRL